MKTDLGTWRDGRGNRLSAEIVAERHSCDTSLNETSTVQ